MSGRRTRKLLVGLWMGTLLAISSPLVAADAGEAPAAEPLDAVKVSVDDVKDLKPEVWLEMPENPVVGDQVEYHLMVEVPAGVSLKVPDTFRFPEAVHVVREGVRLSRSLKDSETIRFELVVPLRLLGIGWVRLPAQTLNLELASGLRVPLKTGKLRFHTGTHFPNEAEPGPSDPEAPVPLSETHWVLIWILVILGVVVVTLGITMLFIRWRNARHVPPPPPPRPPREVALEKLADPGLELLIEQGDFNVYYTILSEIIREYLGGRYGFDSMDLTTTELTARMKQVSMEGVILEEVIVMLQDFDMVKFAKVEPTPERAKDDRRLAVGFVEKTSRGEVRS